MTSEFELLNAYWRAANYLSVGQIYLLKNPLLKEPLQLEHIKPRLLGHFGTTPGINFIYAHLNRMIKKHDLNLLFLLGPGHGAPGLVANTYLEGTYSEFYPEVSQDEKGLQKLFKQFSFPGGIPSHAAAETPGSIHEGGELGYVLSHGYGAAFDNPDLIVCCVVGDGEAETGPLAGSWHGNKFINPQTDGTVLPILHLNGYKISNPTYLSRISKEELQSLFIGMGYQPYFVEGDDPEILHPLMAKTLEAVFSDIAGIKKHSEKPLWPMIILRTPKGWTGPEVVDGLPVENTWRSHQVPLTDFEKKPEHVKLLEEWLKSYKPEELFDESGKLRRQLQELAPKGTKRMGANPHANGGQLLKPLVLPDIKKYEFKIKSPGTQTAESTKILGEFLRDVMKLNLDTKNFRVASPDETSSNRLGALFEVTDKMWNCTVLPTDVHLSSNGRVMEVLSEHLCQGWVEGYLLTGRHAFFSCYEAFIHIIDSMFNQHSKWLKVCQQIRWRKPIASLNYLLTSHVWRQDHNGFSHQDPGFIDLVVNKKAEIVRVYYPPDANTLLSITNHCLQSHDHVNVIVAGKQPELQFLSLEEAEAHCKKGIGVWKWASSDGGQTPDIVLACAGDVPTLETLAAASILRKILPKIKVRVINIVDLMVLQPQVLHPHGLTDDEFDAFFTKDKPIIFAHHGYPWIIHRLTYKRNGHENIHVRGYKEEGTTTTPFDMTVLNELDRFHLVKDAIDRIPLDSEEKKRLQNDLDRKLCEHKSYVEEHGIDMTEIREWKWPVD